MSSMWNQRYSENEWTYGDQPNDFLKENYKRFPKGGHILSLGEGDGRNALFLARQGYKVTALDACQIALDKLEKRATLEELEVETICCDLNDYQFEDKAWDGVLNIWCHVPQSLRKKIHASIATTLKPGGVYLMECYSPDQLKYKTGGPPTIEMLFPLEDVKSELSGLKFIFAKELVRSIHEGPFHDGDSAVTQVIATPLRPSLAKAPEGFGG